MKQQQALGYRLYFQDHLADVVRVVGYGGIHEADFRERLKPLIEKHGDKVALAVSELTHTCETTRLIILKPHVRALCFGLLGPAPGHPQYDEFWQSRGGPPANHKPPEAPRPEKTPARRQKK